MFRDRVITFSQKTIKKKGGEGGGGKGSHTYTLIMLVQAKHGFKKQEQLLRKPIHVMA